MRQTPSSETQGQSGGEGKSKREEKYGTTKNKERREEPLGTMSYQTSSKRSPPLWFLIGVRKRLCFSAQSEGNNLYPESLKNVFKPTSRVHSDNVRGASNSYRGPALKLLSSFLGIRGHSCGMAYNMSLKTR